MVQERIATAIYEKNSFRTCGRLHGQKEFRNQKKYVRIRKNKKFFRKIFIFGNLL